MSASVEKTATTVELVKENQVATVWFKSENGMNVFSSPTLGELGNVVEQLAECCETRYVVLRGEGRAFVAGADIKAMSAFEEDDGKTFAKHGHHALDALEALPQVTFAAINGHAMGGGCEIAMACDFRLMVRGGRIGQPEGKLGLIPGWGGTVRLPRLVGISNARRLMFSGEPVDADEAGRIGLVDEVVDNAEALDATLKAWFQRLSATSPAAMKRIKHALAKDDEVRQFSMCFSCSDAQEGMRAFLEKREPSWSNWCCD